MSRSTEEVLGDHLWQARHGSIEDDLRRNYAEDVVLLTGRGRFRGPDGLRSLNRALFDALGDPRFEYRALLVEGGVGFLKWSANGKNARVRDGADSYLVRADRIVVQTIHYTVSEARR